MNRRVSCLFAVATVLFVFVAPAVTTRADTEVRYGPTADIAAVSALAKKNATGAYTLGPLVVVGPAAFVEIYYTEASGQIFAKKVNGTWKIVETNGGAGTAAEYAKFTHGALTAAQICALGHHMPQGPITDCR
jgi:hypothetical protein